MVIDSSPYKIYLRRFAFTPRTQRLVLAAAAMHELGHSLGISPWTIEGCDNLSFAGGKEAKKQYQETWANYYSVMNYYHIWDKKLVDYSDGSNGAPYDQNDWEEIYLPFFQIESNVMEDPLIEPPGTERVVDEEPIINKEWVFDKNLTEENQDKLNKMCFVKNIECEFCIYVNLEEQNIVRVYAKPIVYPTYTIWTLINEGYIDTDGILHFYSINENIEDINK
jgi:hypothetical protein